MTKGHNKDLHNPQNADKEIKDEEQNTRIQKEKKQDSSNKGRHADPDQSGGTKGPNSI